MSRCRTHRRTPRLILLAALLGILAPFVAASPALAAGPVKITKIHYAQTGTNLDSEYIVFKNSSSSTVNMKGWEIISAPSSDNQHYFFPRTKLAPGHSLTLYTGHGTNRRGKRYWGAIIAAVGQLRGQGHPQEPVRRRHRHLSVHRWRHPEVLLSLTIDRPRAAPAAT